MQIDAALIKTYLNFTAVIFSPFKNRKQRVSVEFEGIFILI
jgi:hypothetical protein